ncbi:MAG: ribosome assembly RNA-binding protein YhbY [Coriobacteriia bacterium]|nr:ribosome assembly RNA-binding protein YhbY [Coriobacteriia bacterium]MBS5478990.1 ribosome assembly RNA-binding protein YhbY [Coriobacteriia bacterium]
MAALTGAQIKQLRGMAHELKPVLMVGKGNITTDVVARANEVLEARELIKCSVLDTSELDVREAAEDLASRSGAQVVQIIGHKFVLYRASHRRDIKRIELV